MEPVMAAILKGIDGLTFDEAREGRVETLIDGNTAAYVISRKHLVQRKLAVRASGSCPSGETA